MLTTVGNRSITFVTTLTRFRKSCQRNLPQPSDRLEFGLDIRAKGRIPGCARTPDGEEPRFPFAFAVDDFRIQKDNRAIAHIADLDARGEICSSEHNAVLRIRQVLLR